MGGLFSSEKKSPPPSVYTRDPSPPRSYSYSSSLSAQSYGAPTSTRPSTTTRRPTATATQPNAATRTATATQPNATTIRTYAATTNGAAATSTRPSTTGTTRSSATFGGFSDIRPASAKSTTTSTQPATMRSQSQRSQTNFTPGNNNRGRGRGGRGRGRGGRGGWNNRPITTDSYYHYTTRGSAQLIQNSGKILMAREHDHYGPGVYFTKWSVKNGHTKQEIAKNNFRAGGDAALRRGRCDWVVEVRIPSNKIRKCPDRKRDIWRYPDRDLMLDEFTYDIYEVQEQVVAVCSSSYFDDYY